MKKPTKYIYKIEASNGHVYVRYISEEYYETNKSNPGSWPCVSHSVFDWKGVKEGDMPKLKKVIYSDFQSGAKAEQYIIDEKALYEEELLEYENAVADIKAKTIADNDNYRRLIDQEKTWRQENLDGKIYK